MTVARQEIAESVLARVSACAVAAVETLASLLECSQPPTVRLGAAKAVLEYGIRLRSEQEIQERLTTIEAHLEAIERNEK
jgi:hypothetical protein